MQIPTCLHAGVAATGIAFVGIGAMTAASVAPVTQTQSQSPPAVVRDVRLAATTVPPGGLITGFLNNQVTYCSIICPLLVQTAVTPIVATLQTPGTFLTALQAGDLLKAIGVAAASVTGPTNAAAAAAILADGSIPAPRALNAFEVAVVGLLNVIPAAAGGLPGIAAALQTARQDTFDALTLPVIPNQPSTVMPHGVVQVAVVSALNVVGAIIFPAFNHILSGAFQVPDAVAQELAATGDPVRALAAGVNAATAAVSAAGADIAAAVVKAVNDIRAATVPANQTVSTQDSATTTPQARTELSRSLAVTSAKSADAQPDTSHPSVTSLAKHDEQPGDSHSSVMSSVKHDDSHPSDATSTKHDEQPGGSHSSATTPAKHDDDPGNSHPVHDAGSKPHHTASK
ncbi:hypothetical protein [Mycobacterium sp. AZCC_0083]|uniref:hypothetical protein n=1 Tax=Mycobacterium sp. AZCC_0083 TaxID=2735882 RepID=UPI00160BFEA3|nr:hypothetical protein [Mycobacterium sp. AZCC_0083]MBB5166413.1 hypothetical protein [Mycobacterium sp. AZCC_0083]